MQAQFVEWGVIVGLLGLGVAILRVMVLSKRDRKADMAELREGLSELKAGQAALDAKVSGLAKGQAELKADMKAGQARLDARVAGLEKGQAGMDARVAGLEKGQERIGHNVLKVVDGLGVVKGELKRIAPREKATTGSS